MKIVLLSNVKDLGEKWDVRDVADGYARNVLIPQGLAAPATGRHLSHAETEQKKDSEKEAESLRKAQTLASAIDGLELLLTARANDSGDLYASIGPKQVAEVFSRDGHHVPAKAIRITEPFKQVGEYPVSVILDHGLEVEIRLIVKPILKKGSDEK